ncbi:MAG: hypothetical protein ACI4MI_04640 [Christensenellales bacterium]
MPVEVHCLTAMDMYETTDSHLTDMSLYKCQVSHNLQRSNDNNLKRQAP